MNKNESKCTYKSLKELYQRELDNMKVPSYKIEKVLALIKEDDDDTNLNRMDNDYWEELDALGLNEAFEEINKKYHIEWNHYNN